MVGALLAATLGWSGDALTAGGQGGQRAGTPAQAEQAGQSGAPQDGAGAPAGAPAVPPDVIPQLPTPVFRGGIDFVRVDVIVTDKAGRPLGDLTASDFEVTEDGKPQSIETFKLVELDGGLMPGPDGPPREIRTDADEELEAARDDVRLFGVFLDDYHVRDSTSMSVRQSLARFIETQLGPSDMIGLMYPLQPLSAVRFSRNHDAVGRAVQQFLGRKYDYRPRNTIEEQYAHYPTEMVERIRNQVSLTAIEGLIVRMGSLKEGRKALVLVSEGYSNMLPPQLRDQNAQMPGFGNPAARNPMAGLNDPNEQRAAFFANDDLQRDMQRLFAAAARHNVAIYTLDPRGLATNEFGIDQNIASGVDRTYLFQTQDTLRQIAEESDGRPIVNRNDLTIAMKQIVMDSSAYYLLGYRSPTGAADGKFHQVRVRVKRPGVQVRTRRGYWAVTPEEARVALTPPKPGPPKAVETALAAIAAPVRSRVVRTWIGTDRGANGKTAVTFVWEPVPPRAGDPARAEDRPARVMLTASTADGAPVFRGRIPEGGGTASPAPAGASRVTFEAPPGPLSLRLAVESTGAETLDSEVREIAIPDMTVSQTVFGTPQLFRARTVRDAQQVRTDPNAIPTAVREFSRTERLLVKITAHGPGGARPALTARLLNRSGQPMNDVPLAPAANDVPLADIPLAGLVPGEYLLEVAASGPGGEAKELIGFRITG